MLSSFALPPQPRSLSRSNSVDSIPSTDHSDIYEWRPEPSQVAPTLSGWESPAALASQAEPMMQFAPVGWMMPAAMPPGSWQFPGDGSTAPHMSSGWLPGPVPMGGASAAVEAFEVGMPPAVAPVPANTGFGSGAAGFGAESKAAIAPSWRERGRRKLSGSSLDGVTRPAAAMNSENSSSGWSQGASPGAGTDPTPTIDELRALHRRLAEVTAVQVAEKPSVKTSHHKRVQSNSSLSTMASETEELGSSWPTPSLRHVLSSGSVSTLMSDMLEDAQAEEGTEFGPIFEEELQAASGEACGAEHAREEADGVQRASGQAEEGSWLEQHQAADQPGPEVEQQQQLQQQQPPAQSRERAAGRVLPTKEFSHGRVPKNMNLAEEFGRNPEEPPTTMMIRNIPNRYTQRELIRELEALGFEGTFDFLYVPIDKATMCNVGYAFVNFVDHSWAMRCMQTFDGYHFKKYRKARGKIASVSVAHIQGLEDNLRHYESSAANGTPRSRHRAPVLMASAAASSQI